MSKSEHGKNKTSKKRTTGHGHGHADLLRKRSHLDVDEVKKLVEFFRAYIGCSKKEEDPKLDRNRFQDIVSVKFGLTDDYIIDRVFRVFDKDADGYVTEEEWVRGCNIYLRGTLDEKADFAFHVYDSNSDGYITREEMFTFLKNSLIKQPTEEDPDEGVRDLVEILLKKLDQDHDSKISLADFKTAIHKDNLLEEALGQCYPNDSFKTLFMENLGMTV